MRGGASASAIDRLDAVLIAGGNVDHSPENEGGDDRHEEDKDKPDEPTCGRGLVAKTRAPISAAVDSTS